MVKARPRQSKARIERCDAERLAGDPETIDRVGDGRRGQPLEGLDSRVVAHARSSSRS